MNNTPMINVPVSSVNGLIGAVVIDANSIGAAEVSHTHVESDITDLQSYLTDAVSDGHRYGRKDGAWVRDEDGFTDAPNNNLPYIRRNLTWEQPGIESSGISGTGVGIKITDSSPSLSYTIPAATPISAGVMTASDKEKLDLLEDADKLSQDVTITVNPGGSFSNLESNINNQPKNLNGFSLIVDFRSGNHIYDLNGGDFILFSGFYNGTIRLKGAYTGGASNFIFGPSKKIEFDRLSNVSIQIERLLFSTSVSNHNNPLFVVNNIGGSLTFDFNGFDLSTSTIRPNILFVSNISNVFANNNTFKDCGPLVYQSSGPTGTNVLVKSFNNNNASGFPGVTYVGVGRGVMVVLDDTAPWYNNVCGTSAIQLQTV